MKKSSIMIALLAAATTALRADVHYSFNFDSVASGSPASLFDSDPLSTAYAVFAPDVDGFGSDIPGTDRWRPDPSAPPVTVDNPTPFGSSTTSNPNAMNAKFQPVLLSSAVPLSNIKFSIRLDGDPFGDSAARVLFLDATGATLQSLAADQTQPNTLLSLNGLIGLTGILFPGGAFYDDFVLDAVPEATTWSALAILGGLFGWHARRRQLKGR